jgi:DNA-directed RNA polymerase subunit RPC12/RpoP
VTFENRIVVGLDDIKAVSFECKRCQSRLTVSPDKMELPIECPACRVRWVFTTGSYNAVSASPYENFVTALGKIRTLLANGAPFTILLEFEQRSE